MGVGEGVSGGVREGADYIPASNKAKKNSVLSLNNAKFSECLEFVYSSDFETKDPTETFTRTSTSSQVLENGKLVTGLTGRRDNR